MLPSLTVSAALPITPNNRSVKGGRAKLGQYERARQLAEDTLTRMRRVLGDDHPDTERLARNLAAVLASLGEHDHACWLQE